MSGPSHRQGPVCLEFQLSLHLLGDKRPLNHVVLPSVQLVGPHWTPGPGGMQPCLEGSTGNWGSPSRACDHQPAAAPGRSRRLCAPAAKHSTEGRCSGHTLRGTASQSRPWSPAPCEMLGVRMCMVNTSVRPASSVNRPQHGSPREQGRLSEITEKQYMRNVLPGSQVLTQHLVC